MPDDFLLRKYEIKTTKRVLIAKNATNIHGFDYSAKSSRKDLRITKIRKPFLKIRQISQTATIQSHFP